MLIVVLGLVAMMSYNLLSCICRALGDSRTPLYFLIVSSLLNIALALLFIVAFGWGVPGSAIALVIAQAVSAVLCRSAIPLALKRLPASYRRRKSNSWPCSP